MPPIDISNLPKNEVTRPFHIAAGIEVFESYPYELTDNECLAWQIHEERPDTFIRTSHEAQNFLKAIEPDQAQAIQKRGREMRGIADLLVAGADRIPGETFQTWYSENPKVMKKELMQKGKVWLEKDLRRKEIDEFQLRMKEVEWEVEDRKLRGVAGAGIIAFGVAIGVVSLTTIAPTAVAVFTGGAIALMGGAVLGRDFLKEIRLPFFN